MTTDRILEGLKVVELATFVLAPAAGTVMADFGAEVLHIESPGIGDPYRYLHTVKPLPTCEQPYCWILTGRNKKSVVVDLKTDAGREIVYKLVKEADVFITNYHPTVLEALEMRHADLQPHNEGLIYAHATGYGDQGEEVEKPGYDATAWWARSGLMDAVRPQGAEHALATAGMGDNPSAMALFGAIMLGLYRRQLTGEGGKVKTSLMANGAWSNSIYIQAALCGAQPFEAPQRTTTSNALVNSYTCKDGRAFYLAMLKETTEWQALIDALERPDLRDDPRFASLEARRANSIALVAELDAIFASKTMSHWRAALDRHKVTFGIINRSEDAPNDEQMIRNGIFQPIEGSAGLMTIDSPITVESATKRLPGSAPALGEHTAEVLESLGYTPQQIADLAQARVVQLAEATT